ncbi:hypothetical protein TSOC_000329 [Tetrabaena socialis]|uniref:Uncharacterized protein n=1 Tax=Tetrabaena socialis TaxID=47790 RepID=A0A2J8AJN2_9CHLO|nr:hypothetical protein TSOC_000329 [Tetrabaena socialis]|eukprot:PNH12719.1 hypothetical protein TSOC_000329 [Tetrabaena socialis]
MRAHGPGPGYPSRNTECGEGEAPMPSLSAQELSLLLAWLPHRSARRPRLAMGAASLGFTATAKQSPTSKPTTTMAAGCSVAASDVGSARPESCTAAPCCPPLQAATCSCASASAAGQRFSSAPVRRQGGTWRPWLAKFSAIAVPMDRTSSISRARLPTKTSGTLTARLRS